MSAAKALGMFGNPVVKVVLALVAIVLWTAYQRNQAATDARAECRAAQLEQTILEMERQRRAGEDALRAATEQAERTQAELAALEDEHNAILAQLADRGSGACAIPVDVLERLRAIQ